MAVEAKRPIHSLMFQNFERIPDLEFFQRGRDILIARAVKGKIGIVPTGQTPRAEAFSFSENNFLRTEVSENRDRNTRDIVVDTRYVPTSIDGRNYTLRPEIAVLETMSGDLGNTTRVETVRELPPGASRVVAETVHRLIAGILLDGGTGEDVIGIYDKAMAELHEGTTNAPREFIRAFRHNSMRGGRLGYLRYRYFDSITSPKDEYFASILEHKHPHLVQEKSS